MFTCFQLRGLLIQAERQLDDNQFLPSSELQQWLQLTYEIELKHYEMKKAAAEKQLVIAKDGVGIAMIDRSSELKLAICWDFYKIFCEQLLNLSKCGTAIIVQ
jgi:hypothetical protein